MIGIIQKNIVMTSKEVDGETVRIFRQIMFRGVTDRSQEGRRQYRYVISLNIKAIEKNNRNF